MNINLEEVPCPVCGHKKYRKLFANGDITYGVEGIYQVVECNKCKLWYQNPQPTQESLPFLYPEDYGPYKGKGTHRFERILSLIQNYNFSKMRVKSKRNEDLIYLRPKQDKHARLLEIGCSNGRRLIDLYNAGYDNLSGTDLSNVAQGRLRSRHIDFRCGDVEDVLAGYQDGEFETVIMSMVIEHLKRPHYVLREINRILKKEGEFLVSTVTRDCMEWHIFKKDAAFFDLPRHMNFFTKKQLVDLLSPFFTEIEMECQVAPIDFWRGMRGAKYRKGFIAACMAYTIPGSYLMEWLAKKRKSSRVSVKCKKF